MILEYLGSLPAEAQAAWAQAFFSVLGIAVAIAIPAAQHIRDRRERQVRETREARAIALLLLPTLSIWIDKISGYERVVDHHLNAHFPGRVDWRSIADALVLGEQGKLLAPKTHLMGEVAEDAQSFFYHLATAQQAATERASIAAESRNERREVEKLSCLLVSARGAAVTAREKLHGLLGKISS